jgi:hypothetical protein
MHPAVQHPHNVSAFRLPRRVSPRDVPPFERSIAVPCVHLSFWTDFRSRRDLRPDVQIDLHLSTLTTCGTSVLTLAQRVHGCSRSEVPFYRARSRSTFTHMFSHTFAVTAPFDTCTSFDTEIFRPQHPETSFAFRRQPSRSVAHPSIFPIPFGTRLQHLSASNFSRCCLNTLTARVHIQRIVIETAGSLVSDQTALLELSRLPTRPPGLRTRQLSPPCPPSRKISSVRLAALPIR